jgi:hypothetical protein
VSLKGKNRIYLSGFLSGSEREEGDSRIARIGSAIRPSSYRCISDPVCAGRLKHSINVRMPPTRPNRVSRAASHASECADYEQGSNAEGCENAGPVKGYAIAALAEESTERNYGDCGEDDQ